MCWAWLRRSIRSDGKVFAIGKFDDGPENLSGRFCNDQQMKRGQST